MKIFESAKIKLTAWYLLIIMTITISFSSFVYIGVSTAAKRALEAQRRRIERQFENFGMMKNMPPYFPIFNEETFDEILKRTLLNLLFINVVILFVSGTLGYILAGETLKPIEEMTKKQKRFISDAAHELKTPLTAMKTDLEVNLRNKNLTLDETKECMKNTIEEIDKLHKFTDNLLQQSKYQNSNNSIIMETLELDKIIETVTTKLKNYSKEKGVAINTKIESIKITGNKDSIEKLFTNLIENAIKYSYKKSTVEIESYKHKNNAVTKIVDHGIGIDPKDIKFIFDPFYRSDKSRTKHNKEGYGLGLAISKEIVEKHHGNIDVQSKINEGTTFIVNLPLIN